MPKRLSSTIPGQMINMEENQMNTQFLLIALSSTTASFLVSLVWANFVSSSIEEVQVATKHRIPEPVSKLIAAFIVTAIVVALMCALYSWERKVGGRCDEKEE